MPNRGHLRSGRIFRLRLLPTLSRDGAVAFDCTPVTASGAGMTFTSWVHGCMDALGLNLASTPRRDAILAGAANYRKPLGLCGCRQATVPTAQGDVAPQGSDSYTGERYFSTLVVKERRAAFSDPDSRLAAVAAFNAGLDDSDAELLAGFRFPTAAVRAAAWTRGPALRPSAARRSGLLPLTESPHPISGPAADPPA